MRSLHSAALFLSAYTTSGPEPLKILRTAPTDEAVPTSVVAVTFDRPVAGSLDRTVDPKAIFTITPAVQGRLEWRDPVTIRLTPAAPLASNIEYTVTVANTFAAMDGSRLEAPYRFTFRVRGPRLLAGSPVSGNRHPKFVTPATRFELVYSAPVDLDRRAVHQLEPSRRCDEFGMAVAAHGRAREEARPANAERKAIRRFEPAAIHRRERVRDGDGVLDVRSERGGGGEADRHRIPPLEPALHGGGDREDRLRVNGSVERAGDRPVERHGDHARRYRLVSRRRAEDFQWLRTGRRVGRQEQRGGVQRTHDIARKEGR